MADFAGPHSGIPVTSEAEKLLAGILDRLWSRYRKRVEWVRKYEDVVRLAGGKFVNDHIAFRTIAWQRPEFGIFSLARMFEALGYQAAGCYQFPDKHLAATHFQHPNGLFPKIFISELQAWKLTSAAQAIIERSLEAASPGFTVRDLEQFSRPSELLRPQLVERAVGFVETVPWPIVGKEDVLALNRESQYGAWVLVHGFNVNHFTALINSHEVPTIDDIEKTMEALRKAGVPVKSEIEGARGSKLRQSATEAAEIDIPILIQGEPGKMKWTYAYFELAERGTIMNLETGKPGRFEGFLGPQATQLFEMTRTK